MKATRLLCVAAIVACLFFGGKIFIHESNSPRFELEPVREQLSAIDDRDQLMGRVEVLLSTLEKADERIHHWRQLTYEAWFTSAFMILMVLITSFAWNRKPPLEERFRDLENDLMDT